MSTISIDAAADIFVNMASGLTAPGFAADVWRAKFTTAARAQAALGTPVAAPAAHVDSVRQAAALAERARIAALQAVAAQHGAKLEMLQAAIADGTDPAAFEVEALVAAIVAHSNHDNSAAPAEAQI